jgi:cytochrome P450
VADDRSPQQPSGSPTEPESGVPRFPFATPPGLDDEPELARLRAVEPVSKVWLPSGHPAWLVTRYADCRAVLADPRFSRALTTVAGGPALVPGIQNPDMLVSMDPPAHTRVRGLVNKAFTYRAVERTRPQVTELVTGLLDGLAGQLPPVDLLAAVADPLPALVVCTVLGIPPADRAPLNQFLEHMGAQQPPPGAAVTEAMAGLAEIIERKRAQPADDLLSALTQAEEGGDRLSRQELLMTTLLLFAAGQDTTRNQLGNSLLTLFRHPDQLSLLRGQPELVPAAVEELVRFTRISQAGLIRIATADVELAGVTIRSGDAVVPLTHSANRDAAVFDRPDELDITRPDAEAHIGYGHGTHYCVGSALARMQLQVALGGLLRRFPALALAVPPDELEWRPGRIIRSLEKLPVTW